jgi:hypothetical protein
MAEERSLPGWPKKRLVKEVRRHLYLYGFRPVKQSAWLAAWGWADKIARSYYHIHWPLPSEIGSLYIVVLLAQMQESHMLRLPYQAKEIMPPEVAALLAALPQQGFPAIEFGERRARRKRKPPAADPSQPLFHNI